MKPQFLLISGMLLAAIFLQGCGKPKSTSGSGEKPAPHEDPIVDPSIRNSCYQRLTSQSVGNRTHPAVMVMSFYSAAQECGGTESEIVDYARTLQ
jgi:hypothetical protein